MNSCVLDLYGSMLDIELRFLQCPRRVVLEFQLDGRHQRIRFEAPVDPEPFLAALDDWWGIRIHDINQEHQQFIEYGRYRVEFWDEDNPRSRAYVDSFEHELLD